MANVYEMVTERIIAELQKGKIPWRKPWISVYGNTEMIGAFNRVTKKSYSLLNQLLLSKDGEYATFNQWQAAGGKIKKGAKSEIVVFWKQIVKETKNDDGETVKETFPVLRYYNVFHIDDVENVKPLEKPENLIDNVYSDDYADRIIMDYVSREGIDYREQKSDDAYYAPALDRVVVPCKEQYKNGNEFYSTAFHELVHSTGNKKRLNRSNQFAAFGSETYSKEELVAEIGAASILNILGMETPESFGNSAAYIQSWISALQNDNRMIVSAGSRAEKAVQYIFGDNDKPEKKEPEKKEPENQDQPENQPENQSAENTGAETEVSVSDIQPEKKKTRKQNRKVIIDRIVSDAIGNKIYANHFESDVGKPSMFDFNGREYFGYIDGHRIIATTKDYGYEKAENPFHIEQFICDGNVGRFNHANEWFKIVFDREKVIEKKRENRKKGAKSKPYIVEIPFDSRTTKYLGINPSFAIDAMDFVGVDYCYLAFNREAWSGGTTYRAGVFFVNDDDAEMENICMVLPINILGKHNDSDQIGSYQPED